MQALLDAMWEHLLPAFGPAPLDGREDDDAALAERLSRLALPATPGDAAPPADPAAWSGAEFAPAGGTCTDQQTLTGIAVEPAEDGCWDISLTDGGERLELRLDEKSSSGWTVDSDAAAASAPPTAVSGGWTDKDTLTFDVVFLETPHRLAVRCSLADRTFTANWRTVPLHNGPLSSMRAPRR